MNNHFIITIIPSYVPESIEISGGDDKDNVNTKTYNGIRTAGDIGTAVKDFVMGWTHND